jgi:hypothetical protein
MYEIQLGWMQHSLEWFHEEFVPAVSRHLESRTIPGRIPILHSAPSHSNESRLTKGNKEAVFYLQM